MNVHDFERIVRTEKSVMRYLAHFCRNPGKVRCPVCGENKIYKVEKGKRMRCSRCFYTFHLLTGRWLNQVKISVRDWMWIIKLFELETSASVISLETGISYPTVLKAVDTIRMSIAGADRSRVPSRRHGPGVPPDMKPVRGTLPDSKGIEHSIPLPERSILYASRLEGSYLILVDRSVRYASLLACGQEIRMVDNGESFPRCRVYCDCGGFWPFAKERLTKHHGVSYDKLHLYLKESEFGWINRNSSIFESLIKKLCLRTPDSFGYADEQDDASTIAI